MIDEYIKMYKEEIIKSIEDLKHKDTFYKQIPNILTFTRLLCGVPAGLLYFLNPYISIGIISFLWFTDAIDGKIATKFNIKSKLGADMDALADKFMFLGSSMPLFANNPGLFLNFILEGVISLITVTGRVKGLNTKTVLSGKIKTVSLALALVSGYLVKFFGIPSMLFNILMGFTTGFQFIAIKDYIIQFIELNKELKENSYNDIIEAKENDIKLDDTLDKVKVNGNTNSLVDDLNDEKELLLGSKKPDKVVEPKVRKREICHRK